MRARRPLVIDVDSSFDEFKSRYEEAVPAFSPDKIAGRTPACCSTTAGSGPGRGRSSLHVPVRF
jgi:hypothetical protein